MDLPQSKLLAVLSLGIGSLFVGLLPACFTNRSRRQWPLLLSTLLCFGGGVLLCTSLVHILPEARHDAQAQYKPYVELIFCGGFFLLYIMDEIVHYFYGEVAGHSHVPTREVIPHSHDHHRHYGATSSMHNERGFLLGYGTQPAYNPSFSRAKSDSVLFCDEPPSQLCHVMHQSPCQSSVPTTNLGLLVALSIHSILEGLVVGLEGVPNKVLLLLGAIASHKLVVGFCLGVELASNQYTTFCRHFICIVVFAVASVAGIFIGMAVARLPSGVMDTTIPMLQALAGGTLLFVCVSEVLPRERARWHQEHGKRSAGAWQLVSVLAGFVMMTVLSKCLGKMVSSQKNISCDKLIIEDRVFSADN